jgi:hypothetical protein
MLPYRAKNGHCDVRLAVFIRRSAGVHSDLARHFTDFLGFSHALDSLPVERLSVARNTLLITSVDHESGKVQVRMSLHAMWGSFEPAPCN